MVAKRIADNMEQKKMAPTEAIEESVAFSSAIAGGDGGAIALDASGRVGVAFDSQRMGWAYVKNGRLVKGCDRGQIIQDML